MMENQAADPTTPEACWFGPEEAPLAGFVHHPDQEVRGGVVICAPFGYEEVCAHRTLRYLAAELAGDGIMALRFDYAGEGASSGESGSPRALADWQDSVLAAVQELRRRGIARPAVVGLRLGGALACQLFARDSAIGPVVLWAPTTSGRRAARELKALSLITPGRTETDRRVNVLGHPIARETLTELRAWRPLAAVPAGHPLLLVESPGWRDAQQTRADLDELKLTYDVVESPGTVEVLERDAELVRAPTELVGVVVDWLGARLTRQNPPPGTDSRSGRGSTRVVELGVREELVSIPPLGLHGVLCQPEGDRDEGIVLFLNNGVAPARGPARAWSEFSRALAVGGTSALRVDLSGLGDSPDPPGPPVIISQPVSPRASRDVQLVVDWIRQRGYRRVIVVGLCSGGLISLLTAGSGRLDVDAIVSLNAPLCAPRNVGDGPWVWHVWQLMTWGMHRRRVRAQMHKLPHVFWSLLDSARVFPSPERLLRDARRHVEDVTVIYNDGEELVDIIVRLGKPVSSLCRDELIDMRVIEGMDHSLFDPQYRRRVLDIIREKVAVNRAVPERP